MPLDNVRWRIGQAVRRALLAVRADHPLRRAYGVARQWPPIRKAWRLISKGASESWRDVAAYAERGGAFGATMSNAHFGLPPAFYDPHFFDDLVQRIDRCETRAPQQELIVLINNGLAAGGAERQIVHTLTGLKSRGRRTLFIGEYLGAAGLDFHLDALSSAGVESLSPPRVTKPGGGIYQRVSRPVADSLARFPAAMMTEILDMIATLRARNPGVVHLWQDETSTKHGISALIAGVPRIVLSGRNVNPTHFEFHQPYMRAAYRALASSDRVILSNNSHAGAASYAEWLGIDEKLIRVVHNGVDLRAWPDYGVSDREAFRSNVGLTEDQPVVIGVFRLSEEKRPLLWLEAAARMKSAVPDAAFLIAGDGPMRRDVERTIERLGLTGSVNLLGEIPGVARAISASDIFFLASRQEGIPNALLEAQRYGLACLITNAGGASEAIADGVSGRIALSDAPAKLGDALVSVWRDEFLRASAKAKGPAFVESRFGIERMIDETLALYGV